MTPSARSVMLQERRLPVTPNRPIQAGAVILAVGALLLAQLQDGGNTILGGLTRSACGATALALLLIAPWSRKSLSRGAGELTAPASAFVAVVMVALWSMTPWVPGGAHPAWSYVTALGAATLARSNTWIETIKLGGLACTFLVAYVYGRADDRARLAAYSLVCLGALYAIWALIRYGVERDSVHNRLTASFQSANTAATLFGILIVISTTLAIAAHRRVRPSRRRTPSEMLAPAPYWTLTGLFAACLFLTASRGGVLATGVALAMFFGMEALAGRLHIVPALAGLAGGGLLLLLQGSILLERINEHSPGGFDRAHMFAVYWRAFQESPLMGYGLGTFDIVNKLNLSSSTFGEDWSQRAAHNVYLQWLLEAGLIGAIPMFSCIGLILFRTWRGLGRRRRATTLVRGLMAAAMVFLAHGWTDFALQVPAMAALFALLLGLQLGLANGSSGEPA